MSSTSTLSFRDSLDTVAGRVDANQVAAKATEQQRTGQQRTGQQRTEQSSNETTRILSERSHKYVKFNNEPVIYYYHPEIGIPSSLRSNYSEIFTGHPSEPPSVYLYPNGKKEYRCMIYLIPFLIFMCLILIVLFLIFTFFTL